MKPIAVVDLTSEERTYQFAVSFDETAEDLAELIATLWRAESLVAARLAGTLSDARRGLDQRRAERLAAIRRDIEAES